MATSQSTPIVAQDVLDRLRLALNCLHGGDVERGTAALGYAIKDLEAMVAKEGAA